MMADLINKEKVIKILLNEYKDWRDVETEQIELDYISMGAIGAISNVISEIVMLPTDGQVG